MSRKFLILILIFLWPTITFAATKIWVGADSNWATAASWSPSGVPVTGDNVYLENSSASVTSGFSQSAVLLASLNIAQNYTGQIGDDVNYLQIGATECEIGYNVGPSTPVGSGRIRLNFGTNTTSTIIYNSGTPVETTKPSILLLDVNASSTIEVRKGKVGIAFNTGEVSTIGTINLSYVSQVSTDVIAVIGAGTTLTTLNQTGGSNTLLCAATTVMVKGGELLTSGTGAVTTLTIEGGTATSNATGTITTATINNLGTLDLTKSSQARTITTCSLDASGTFKYDPDVITITNKINSNDAVVLRASRP